MILTGTVFGALFRRFLFTRGGASSQGDATADNAGIDHGS